MFGDEARCIEAGMDAYIPKPIERRVLIGMLQRYLKGSRGGAQPPAAEANDTAQHDEGDLHELQTFLTSFRQDLGESVLKRVVSTIATELPSMIGKLREMADAGPASPTEVAQLAHALRGASRTVGLRSIGQGLLELEQDVHDTEKAKRLAHELGGRLDTVYRSLMARSEFA
jgi:CheY-like chemotaxis protein